MRVRWELPLINYKNTKVLGYKAENNYGLEVGLDGDQAKCMAAIMYERQVNWHAKNV